MNRDTIVLLVFSALCAIGVLLDLPIVTVFARMAAAFTALLWIAARCPLCAWAIIGLIHGLTGRRGRWW